LKWYKFKHLHPALNLTHARPCLSRTQTSPLQFIFLPSLSVLSFHSHLLLRPLLSLSASFAGFSSHSLATVSSHNISLSRLRSPSALGGSAFSTSFRCSLFIDDNFRYFFPESLEIYYRFWGFVLFVLIWVHYGLPKKVQNNGLILQCFFRQNASHFLEYIKHKHQKSAE
jgi:hypothetical protein